MTDAAAYGPITSLATLTLVVYVVGVPVLYFLLLKRASRAIVSGRHTSLSRALAFYVPPMI